MKLILILLLMGCIPDKPEEPIPLPETSKNPKDDPTGASKKPKDDEPGTSSSEKDDGAKNPPNPEPKSDPKSDPKPEPEPQPKTDPEPQPKTDPPKETEPKTEGPSKKESLGPKPGESTGPRPKCAELYIVETAGNGTVMRKGPGYAFEAVFPPLEEGTLVKATGSHEGWVDASSEGQVGYVDARFLSCTKTGTPIAIAEKPTQTLPSDTTPIPNVPNVPNVPIKSAPVPEDKNAGTNPSAEPTQPKASTDVKKTSPTEIEGTKKCN